MKKEIKTKKEKDLKTKNPDKTVKLAAIDIGSNAARLLISQVLKDPGTHKVQINKINLVRVPLRLGFDVFEKGIISQEKKQMVIETMKAYAHLLKAYEVSHVKACATSAMRDAANSAEIIEEVKKKTGLSIRIISGDEEASLIYENHIAENLDKKHSYLYIDVGGGSTELTFFSRNKISFRRSFNIGTVRLVKKMTSDSDWNDLKSFLSKKLQGKDLPLTAIGSGGNINKLFSLSKTKEGKPLSINLLEDYLNTLSQLSVKERMSKYKLREDRADVIVPALLIYTNIMHWTSINEIYVPKIGLADGLIHKLYNEIEGNE